MALPVSYYSESINDNTVKNNGQPESASWEVSIATLTAANLVAKEALITALHIAVSPFILGVTKQTAIVLDRSGFDFGPASSPLAQRENKLLIRYHDQTTGKKFRTSIPTLDLTKLMTNSEFVDLATGDGLALKTAWEAIVVSPDDGANSVVMDSAQFVGRNT